MEKNRITPGVVVNAIRENMNNNKTLKAIFSNQFLKKFSADELEGLQASIKREIDKREEDIIQEKIDYLQKHGYSVQK